MCMDECCHHVFISIRSSQRQSLGVAKLHGLMTLKSVKFSLLFPVSALLSTHGLQCAVLTHQLLLKR